MAASACQREKARTHDAVLSAGVRCERVGGGGARATRAWVRRLNGQCTRLAAMWCSTCMWAASWWSRRDVDGARPGSAGQCRSGCGGASGAGEKYWLVEKEKSKGTQSSQARVPGPILSGNEGSNSLDSNSLDSTPRELSGRFPHSRPISRVFDT